MTPTSVASSSTCAEDEPSSRLHEAVTLLVISRSTVTFCTLIWLEEVMLEEYEKLPFVEVPFTFSIQVLACVVKYEGRDSRGCAAAAMVMKVIQNQDKTNIEKWECLEAWELRRTCSSYKFLELLRWQNDVRERGSSELFIIQASRSGLRALLAVPGRRAQANVKRQNLNAPLDRSRGSRRSKVWDI
jgi:hypothetical protein